MANTVLGVGKPRVQGELVDSSVIRTNPGAGVTAVLGITQKGDLNKPVLIQNSNEFRKVFGDVVEYSLFPLYCLRALDAGAVLMVNRIAHYTDIADRSTAVGVKATKTANGATFTARNIGSWGNGISVVLSDNVNDSNVLNIAVTYNGKTKTSTIPKSPTPANLTSFNALSEFIEISAAATLTAGTVILANGSEDYSGITDDDKKGNAQAKTGLHAFDSAREPIRLCLMEGNTPAIEFYYTEWAKKRNDILMIFPLPTGIEADEAVQYRTRTGAYTGTPVIDYWGAIATFGDIEVLDPLTDTPIVISSIGDFIGRMGYRDLKTDGAVWKTFAFYEFGRIPNVIDVPYNLGSAALSNEANLMSLHHINYIQNHEAFGAVIWEALTLQKSETLLKHSNVAELTINLLRNVKTRCEKYLGKQNNLQTWKNIYAEVAQYMTRLNNLEAFQSELTGTGEGSGWLYEGDQDIDDITDAVVNDSNDVDNGIYRFKLFFAPTSPLKFIGFELTVSNSGVAFSISDAV
jgi:hypothetical protein